MTLTAYAAHRGCSVKAVSKAVAAGRLVESVGRNERDQPTILDAALADREWGANTRQRADRPAVPHGTPQRAVASIEVEKPETDPAPRRADLPAGVPVYSVSQAVRAAAAARREIAAADTAELELAAKRGQLVDAEAARADVEQAYSLVKTRLLRVPSDLAQRLPHLAAEVVPVLEELQREALEELAR